MQLYQFEKVFSQMKKEFGKIKNGEEEFHSMMLMPLESNVLKVHRNHPTANSRRLQEALALVLFDLKTNYGEKKFALDTFRNDDNRLLEQALLMAFDPFTNKEVEEELAKTSLDLTNKEQLRDYYQEPIICLLKIKDSVDLWVKQNGSDGYFIFLEGFIGKEISGNKMNFAVPQKG